MLNYSTNISSQPLISENNYITEIAWEMHKHRYVPTILIISIIVKNILYKIMNLILQCQGWWMSGSGYSTCFRNLQHQQDALGKTVDDSSNPILAYTKMFSKLKQILSCVAFISKTRESIARIPTNYSTFRSTEDKRRTQKFVIVERIGIASNQPVLYTFYETL